MALIRAVILQELGRRDEARASLALFRSTAALPEESALADRIATQLAAM